MKQLTKREYLGLTYVHIYTDDVSGDEVVVECTQGEYEALELPNPVNPTKKGCTWVKSLGGSIKVDTPTTLLGVDEYCDWNGGYFVMAKTDTGKIIGGEVKKTDIVADKIDITKI